MEKQGIESHCADLMLFNRFNGIIVFPKKWALLEVKQKYIDEPVSFNSDAFKKALECSGFPTDHNIEFNVLAAQNYLTDLYESIEEE